MTYEYFWPNVFKLFVLLAIVFRRSNVDVVEATVRMEDGTRYEVTVSSEAYPSSHLPRTRQVATTVPASTTNGERVAVVNPVKGSLEVTGHRVVEPDSRGKVERKRESGAGTADLRQRNEEHACVLRDDAQLKEEDYKAHRRRTGDDVGILRASLGQIARAGKSGWAEDEEYEDDNEDKYVVADQTKMRRNLRRKAIAGRHYREGPNIWDQWGKWTSCSVSCGAGKLTRWRHCVGGGCSLGNRREPDPKIWDRWGRWSCCSATCGSGKYTRWRHCVAGSCVSGEKEAQIKSCDLKRCS